VSGPASSKGTAQAPWVWGECTVDKAEVVVRLKGWRRLLATRSEVRFSLASVTRVEHDPLARAHVRSGLRNWRRHGQGVWRIGIYHGIDGWSFWSIGIGRNAVLMECSGERFRYVVVEVADPARTVREIRAAAGRLTGEIPGGLGTPRLGNDAPDASDAAGREEAQTGKIEAMDRHQLDYESHLDALGRECDLLIDLGAEDLAVAVPTCPEWQLSDLIEHLGDVFLFWHTQLEASAPEAPTQPPAKGLPPGSDLIEWFQGACNLLKAALGAHEPTDPCWNWSGTDMTARWVARRTALETAVHRYDAELAISAPTPIKKDLAVDGIEEWISVHLATDVPEAPEANLGGVLCLACADDAAAWTVEITSGRLRWREGRGPADAVLVGPASDLYLYCWNRKPLEALELTGSREVALAWTSLPI